MSRAILFAGSSFALKSVFLRVEAFALYTSPKPPAAPPRGVFPPRRCRSRLAAGAAGPRRYEHERRREQRQERHHPQLSRCAPLFYVHRASFRHLAPVSEPASTVRAGDPVGRKTRPRSDATRSPETNIPTMIAAPKT